MLGRKKNPLLRIVQEEEQPDAQMQEMKEKIRQHKKKFRIRVMICAAVVLAVLVGTYLFLTRYSYKEARIVETYNGEGYGQSSYTYFRNMILKYSKDGISLIRPDGKEAWNQPCQLQNPMAEVRQETAAIADCGGNDILVVGESGLKGEIHTTKQIEKIALSPKGIVAAILKDEVSPMIVCYDSAGNTLVENKASFKNHGYPVDVSISDSGELLMVSYAQVENNMIQSRVVFYNFGKAGQDKQDHIVETYSYENQLVPSVFFMAKDTEVIVGEHEITICRGAQKPQVQKTISFKKDIKSICYDDNYIGVVLKGASKGGYELQMYSSAGRQMFSKEFQGEFSNVKMYDGEIFMYEGNKCSIYTKDGIHRFDGELIDSIVAVFPEPGINKYNVITANSMQEIRLVK